MCTVFCQSIILVQAPCFSHLLSSRWNLAVDCYPQPTNQRSPQGSRSRFQRGSFFVSHIFRKRDPIGTGEKKEHFLIFRRFFSGERKTAASRVRGAKIRGGRKPRCIYKTRSTPEFTKGFRREKKCLCIIISANNSRHKKAFQVICRGDGEKKSANPTPEAFLPLCFPPPCVLCCVSEFRSFVRSGEGGKCTRV